MLIQHTLASHAVLLREVVCGEEVKLDSIPLKSTGLGRLNIHRLMSDESFSFYIDHYPFHWILRLGQET